ncbi:MAG: ADP-ribosylglycohydrolase family protein, partial [Haloferacaceae archaeon]
MPGLDDRAAGALLGLACGDALGRPVEGWSGAEIARQYGRVTDMRAGGSEGRPAGATTAVTARALRVARTLVGEETAAPAGTTDPTGSAPGTPGTDDGAVPVVGVPPGVAYHDAPEQLPSAVPALLADGDEHAVAAAVALARVVAELVGGKGSGPALDAALAGAADRNAPPAVRTALATATDGATASPGEQGGSVGALETALHDGLTAPSAEAAVVAAVNRGGPTTAAG